MKTRKNSVKIISMISLCSIMALTFALIPFNIFCINFPEWVTALLSVLFFCGLIAWLIVFKTKTAAKIILPAVFGFFAVICSLVKYLPVDDYLDGSFDWRCGFLNFHSTGRISNKRYKDLTFEGSVYILTDNQTFSSAKDFAMLIQDNHLGKIVGEPSANSVNGYGEVTYFYLPNTGLYVQISTKKWYRIDETNTDDYVMPDYPCESRKSIEKLYEVMGQ